MPSEDGEMWKQIKQERQQERAGRVQAAADVVAECVLVCAEMGVTLTALDHDQHWRFVLPGGKHIDWWPGSGKFVVGQQWQRARQVFGFVAALAAVKKEAVQ